MILQRIVLSTRFLKLLLILFIYFIYFLSGKSNNFDTYPQTYLDNFYTHYDYYSIMHYPMYAFSRNGQPTVVPRLLGVTIGNRNDLSITDLVRIRHYYDCGKFPWISIHVLLQQPFCAQIAKDL